MKAVVLHEDGLALGRVVGMYVVLIPQELMSAVAVHMIQPADLHRA